jgi:hypothetical protein
MALPFPGGVSTSFVDEKSVRSGGAHGLGEHELGEDVKVVRDGPTDFRRETRVRDCRRARTHEPTNPRAEEKRREERFTRDVVWCGVVWCDTTKDDS